MNGEDLLREIERDRADARAWRRFESSGLLTRLWMVFIPRASQERT